ncbi:MAG: AmmeMemoRadiSam system protein B [Candidatus Omnitrophica bacterium]|nr:AmmeMemoRadiSam system protein B [Candidatus Omnitrophota bacterium]
MAGTFYSSSPTALRDFFAKQIPEVKQKVRAKAIVVPHAGYMFSGDTAAKVFGRVQITDTVILLGPNHSGEGVPFSVDKGSAWRTPLGEVKVDGVLASQIIESCPHFSADNISHRKEHSLEVEVPFLQYLKPDVKIVPITIGTDLLRAARAVADGLAKVLKGKDILIVASTDLNHYEPQDISEQKDKAAIDAVLALDAELLHERVRDDHISMCGYIPTYVMLRAVRQLGATTANLVDYHTSGEVSGDFTQVVGYAGIVIA